jgi:hypothetical protein
LDDQSKGVFVNGRYTTQPVPVMPEERKKILRNAHHLHKRITFPPGLFMASASLATAVSAALRAGFSSRCAYLCVVLACVSIEFPDPPR